jgi:hypothetical protein
VDNAVRRRILSQLVALSIAASSGLIEPTGSLQKIPEAIMVELVDDTRAERGLPKQLLRLLAADPRPSVRERVASAASSLAPHFMEDAEQLIARLCADESLAVRTASTRALTNALALAPPLLRIEIVSRWSLSPHVSQRRAIARALRNTTSVFVSDLALEELSKDEDTEVRALAARAIARRFLEAPEAYGRALARLGADPHPRVARTVTRLKALDVARLTRA